ncbi:MAG: dicarboxylate/amino acid:cation symporter [Bradymonadia bacterium]
MQIYTKILLGMLAGTVIGLTLGPTSSVLEADVYSLEDASAYTLQIDVDDPSTTVKIPKMVKVKFEILEQREDVFVDKAGKSHTLPAWSKVEFSYSKEMAIRDTGGQLAEAFNKPKQGERLTAWLKLKHIPLEKGEFVTSPSPISGLGETVISWLSPIGKIFMRLIKMVIVPLVFASLLVGVASLGDIRKLGRLGGRTLLVYMVTTAVAITVGLVLAQLVDPGSFMEEADKARLTAQFQSAAGTKVAKAAAAPSTLDNILSIIPANPMESLSTGNMLQVIFFAAIFGIALTMLGAKEAKPVVTFFDKVQLAMIQIIHMVMLIAPFGVAALIAEVVGNSGASVLLALLGYGLTVVAGLLIHGGLIYGGMVKFVAKLSWVDFMKAIRPAQLIAFSTSSSSAALPVSMECAEQNLRVSNPVASFVLPLGSTVNMDGTALYQGVAAMFIAQVFGIDLTIGDQVSIVAAATMASVGAAGVPGAGMITLAMVLTSAGIPTVGIALILGMDRLLDMFRTAVNVTGDLTVTAMMAALEGEDVRPMTASEDQANPNQGFEGRLEHQPEAVEPD